MTEQKNSKMDDLVEKNETSKNWEINPEKAIKNMKWIVVGCTIIAAMIAFAVQINVKESNDLRTSTSLSIEIVFGIFISLVVYVYSKRMHNEIKKHQEDVQKHIEQAVDQTANKIVEKVVDVANAQFNVKEGGKVAIRKEAIRIDMMRNDNGNIQIGNNVSDVKIVGSNQVVHSTDSYIVAENNEKILVDTIIADNIEKQIDDTKKELEDAKRKLVKLKTKNKKRKLNRKNQQKKVRRTHRTII